MPSNLVIYHKDCYDGFGAAWVCKNVLKGETEFLPASYGDSVPSVEGKHVYIVDFSYPRIVLEEMKLQAASLIVLDHHKTAEANLAGLEYCIFDMTRSGAMLAWNHFYPNTQDKKAPLLIQFVQDRDLWNWAMEYSSSINNWISSYPRDFNVWNKLDERLEDDFQHCYVEGWAIERYHMQKVEEILQQSKMINLDGYDVPVVNCPYAFGSDVGNQLLKKYPDAKFSAYYLDRGDGEQQWGLRSNGFDVSEIAKQFGGGGHQRAAGFLKGKASR